MQSISDKPLSKQMSVHAKPFIPMTSSNILNFTHSRELTSGYFRHYESTSDPSCYNESYPYRYVQYQSDHKTHYNSKWQALQSAINEAKINFYRCREPRTIETDHNSPPRYMSDLVTVQPDTKNTILSFMIENNNSSGIIFDISETIFSIVTCNDV